MNSRSKSTLFLIEQLIVVAVFAICAAACTRILAASYFMATETRDLSNAIHAAESGAESFKAVGGDIGKTARILGGAASDDGGAAVAVVYYDRHWQVSAEADAYYCLSLRARAPEPASPLLAPGELTVEKLTGERLIGFEVAAIRSD